MWHLLNGQSTKTIVTTGRENKYTRVAWLLTVLMVIPLVVMVAVSVRHEMILVVDVIWNIFLLACISFIAYFYFKAYLAVRNWNRTRIRPVNDLAKGKLESKVAYTTFWLTVFVGVSTFPIFIVHLFQGALPFFRQIFHYTMGRNSTSVKLSVPPTIVLV